MFKRQRNKCYEFQSCYATEVIRRIAILTEVLNEINQLDREFDETTSLCGDKLNNFNEIMKAQTIIWLIAQFTVKYQHEFYKHLLALASIKLKAVT